MSLVCGLAVAFECKTNERENHHEKAVMIKISKMTYFGAINLPYFLLCLLIRRFKFNITDPHGINNTEPNVRPHLLTRPRNPNNWGVTSRGR